MAATEAAKAAKAAEAAEAAELVQMLQTHPKYKTIETEVQTRLPNRFSDILAKRWENVVKLHHIPHSRFYYDIYDNINIMLDNIQHYFNRMTADGVSFEKRHRFMTLYMLLEIIVLILDIESLPFHPKDRRTAEGVRINLSYKNFKDMRETVRLWSESDYALLPGFRFQRFSDYMAVYIDSLETYIAYRHDRATEEAATVARGVPATRVYLKKLSVVERLELFHTIKRTMIPLLNLHHTLNRPEYPLVEARLMAELRKQLHDRKEPSIEMFLYPWYFIVQPVFHYRTDEPTLVPPTAPTVPVLCAERLRGIRKEYKDTDTLRSITTFCSILADDGAEAEFKVYRMRLMEEFQQTYPIYNPTESWEVDDTQTIAVENIPRNMALYALFLIWLNHSDHLKTPEDFWGYYLNTTFAGEEGVYVGVQQDLLQTCLNQLADLSPALFAPTEPGSDRWMLQRDFRPSPEAMAYLHGGADVAATNPDPYYTTKAFQQDFVRFVGGLMSRCLLAGLSWPFKLSFYTLGYLYNPGYKFPDLYAAYYFMDYPKRSAETLGLLKMGPEDFPNLYLTFNTPYPITQEDPTIDLRQQAAASAPAPPPPKTMTARRQRHYQAKKRRAALERMRKHLPPSPKNPDITAENVLEYIRRTARYVLTTLNARDPAVIPESERRVYKRARAVQMGLLNAFRQGFYTRLEGISTSEMRAVQICDQMSHQDGLRPEKVREWLAVSPPTVVYPFIDPDTTSAEQRAYLEALRPQQTLVAEVFLNDILGNPKVAIPFHRLEKEIQKKMKRGFFYKSFLPTLLYFWTSARTLLPNAPYTIAFQLNDPAQDPHALARLPVSHTCFNQLDLPTFYPNMTREGIRETLMERLVIAIYKNVGFGAA